MYNWHDGNKNNLRTIDLRLKLCKNIRTTRLGQNLLVLIYKKSVHSKREFYFVEKFLVQQTICHFFFNMKINVYIMKFSITVWGEFDYFVRRIWLLCEENLITLWFDYFVRRIWLLLNLWGVFDYFVKRKLITLWRDIWFRSHLIQKPFDSEAIWFRSHL